MVNALSADDLNSWPCGGYTWRQGEGWAQRCYIIKVERVEGVCLRPAQEPRSFAYVLEVLYSISQHLACAVLDKCF